MASSAGKPVRRRAPRLKAALGDVGERHPESDADAGDYGDSVEDGVPPSEVEPASEGVGDPWDCVSDGDPTPVPGVEGPSEGTSVDDGSGVSVADGDSDGVEVGVGVGESDGVSLGDGDADGSVGGVPAESVGDGAGLSVGVPVGDSVGVCVGVPVGDSVGVSVGVSTGASGESDGLTAGEGSDGSDGSRIDGRAG